MFSSNQILKISGSLTICNELEQALVFALQFYGDLNNMKQKKCKCVFQITEDGRYCIGWNTLKETEKGWNEFPFDFDIDIITRIIRKHLENYPIEKDIWDGGYEKGFLMEAIPESLSSEAYGITEPFYGIVSFKPYTCFYSK